MKNGAFTAWDFVADYSKQGFNAVLDTVPDLIHWAGRIFWEGVLPAIVLYLVFKAILKLYGMIMKLHV